MFKSNTAFQQASRSQADAAWEKLRNLTGVAEAGAASKANAPDASPDPPARPPSTPKD